MWHVVIYGWHVNIQGSGAFWDVWLDDWLPHPPASFDAFLENHSFLGSGGVYQQMQVTLEPWTYDYVSGWQLEDYV